MIAEHIWGLLFIFFGVIMLVVFQDLFGDQNLSGGGSSSRSGKSGHYCGGDNDDWEDY